MDKIFVKEALFSFLQTIHKFEQKELEKFSLTWEEVLLLKNLLSIHECRMGTVTEILNIKSFQATRLVDGLVEKEFVDRYKSKNDKRIKFLAITKKGKKRISEIDDFHHLVIQKAAEELGINRTEEILQTLFHLEQLLGLSK